MTYEPIQISDGVSGRTVSKKFINFRLYLCALSVDLLLIGNGSVLAWIGPVLPQLRSNDTEINPLGAPITTLQVSILSAIPYIGLVFGTILLAKVSEKIGRKKIFTYCSIGIILFLGILAFSSNIYLYYVCLFLNGFLLDGVYMNIFMYNNEIAEKSDRGKFGCAAGLCWSVGTVYGYAIGSVTSVRTLTLFCTLPAVLHLLSTPVLVETPAFLTSKGKQLEALKSLEILRRHKTQKEVRMEYELIEKTEKINVDAKGKFSDLFKTKALKRAMIISMAIEVTQQMSGVLIVMFHIPIIFQDADVKIPGNIVAICINLMQVIIFLIPTFLVDRMGKRPFVLFSSASCSVTMFFLALYFYLKHLQVPIVEGVFWVPVAFSILFITAHCLGLAPLPLVIISELFPADLKPTAIGTTLVLNEILMILIVFTYPLISEIYGIYCCMWSYSAFTLIGFIVLYFVLPETKGRTLLEIQDILNR